MTDALHELKSLQPEDCGRLMAIYIQGNEENAEHAYPYCGDRAQALKRAEQDFISMLETEFFIHPQNFYFVLEEEGIWVSALRLYDGDGFYHMEALETDPRFRRRGYAARLLSRVLSKLGESGPFIVRDCVRKTNIPSLSTHKKCGFEIEHQNAVSALTGETDERSHGMIYRHVPMPI